WAVPCQGQCRGVAGPTRASAASLTLAGDLLPAAVELVDRALGHLVALAGFGALFGSGPGRRVGQLVLDRDERCFGRLDLALELSLVAHLSGGRRARLARPCGFGSRRTGRRAASRRPRPRTRSAPAARGPCLGSAWLRAGQPRPPSAQSPHGARRRAVRDSRS